MNNTFLIAVVIILAITICILLVKLIMYRRQVKSICRQIRMHREEESSIDYRLDEMSGPFRELQKELNLIEIENRKKNKMHKANEEAWKQLVTNVSHDIRTPITSVSGYFQLLLETNDENKKKEYADIILSRLRRFGEMLEDFFAYSTTVSMDRKIEIEHFCAARAVTETLFMYYKEIEARFGTPLIEIPEEAMCYGNKEELSRVIQNIIKNALTYGNKKFRVTICVNDNVDLFFENDIERKLNKEDIERVFERTYRLDSSRKEPGSGLGLCIVKELVTKMNGSVEAYIGDDNSFGIHITMMKG